MHGGEDRSVFELTEVLPNKSSAYGELADQVIDFYLPDETEKPIIVLIHGGFWRHEYDCKHLSPLADAFVKAGWPVALIEYRRIMGNPDSTISDVSAALAIISSEFKRMIIIGHTAGGHLALLVANKFKPLGLIVLAPVTDLVAAEALDLDDGAVSDFLGVPAKMRSDINPIANPALDVPALLFHGALDVRVPIAQSRDYVSKMASDATKLIELADIGHFELIDPRTAIFGQICTQLNGWN